MRLIYKNILRTHLCLYRDISETFVSMDYTVLLRQRWLPVSVQICFPSECVGVCVRAYCTVTCLQFLSVYPNTKCSSLRISLVLSQNYVFHFRRPPPPRPISCDFDRRTERNFEHQQPQAGDLTSNISLTSDYVGGKMYSAISIYDRLMHSGA
jgi:hypothetical protein